ncbi:acetolactate synthase AlsS [Listeria monocytogenes]|uniref:Acetolactate synthase AlsS n=2 Tax=Listeria monocytogenes TaxID=1639 RepID=A0A6W3P8U8_LISMN|nr:acetolactate synthase AlsS [Listeria monocytogenes]EHC6019333.1 acetolactate synthase AlsS [Listeria monocytogenes serotype 1/2a]ALU78476.1 acetolactate synthase [Listeria monocytogenes]EAC2744160.1 acetolactate synthase AlsS [Listeria monocytogenes]EAC2747068.1 acetolactate synthase AlsS [Listeria monocytogenes]EAC4709509.1 acetolactate synthase AlsS [Listeria monocytogenes]
MAKLEKDQEKVITQGKSGADLVVDSLINQGVTHVFGIPGAKIDKVFDVMEERGPELIVSRHEQNAAFMAAAIGRLTGKPGVVLVTSGPGASNLATGLVTATAEGDPVVAIAGNVTRQDRLKRTHQSMDNAALFRPITKYSEEVVHAESIPEAITNAFRSAAEPNQGAAFVSLPQDIVNEPNVPVKAIRPLAKPENGPASKEQVAKLVARLKKAKLPVLLLGMRASSPEVTGAIRRLLQKTSIPVVETFQAAGVISRDLEDNFFGRVGLFRNQPGDILLNKADLVITVGYDPIEYDPKAWNASGDRTIVHLDDIRADIDHYYQPVTELVGNIALTLDRVNAKFSGLELAEKELETLKELHAQLEERDVPPESDETNRVHPLSVIQTLRSAIDDNVTVTVDVGSHYIWMARHFRSYEPRRLLFSNGMQTLGVALPWGIAATLVHPGEKVVSISGDGGFLFSAMELETAVRLRAPLVHLVWNDGSYDMVAFQQKMKYGKEAAVRFGDVDIVKFAESFGAKGLRVTTPAELSDVLKEALETEGPVVVDIPIDYRDNIKLGETLLPDQFY